MKKYQFLFRILFSLFMLTWAIAATIPVRAADPVATWNSSDLRDQPNLRGQGIMLKSINQEVASNKRAMANWFAHGDSLEAAWWN